MYAKVTRGCEEGRDVSSNVNFKVLKVNSKY